MNLGNSIYNRARIETLGGVNMEAVRDGQNDLLICYDHETHEIVFFQESFRSADSDLLASAQALKASHIVGISE